MTGRDPNGDAVAPDDDLPGPYVAVRSVDSGSIARIAADDVRLVLASVSGGISVLAPDGDVQFAVEGRPSGLAVGSLVYVALDDRVFGYADDGSRRWEVDVDGVSALCWLPESKQVVAATDGGEFVLLDGGTGSERRRIDRAHADVSEDVSLAGRGEEFLAGESWYLTGFDADGDRRGEAMLDGTITGIGLLDGVAVASLHGDRIVGVGDDGTTRWSRDVGVEWLAPRGEDGVYAAVDRGIIRIAPDGDVADIGVDATDSTQVAITADGSLACRIDGRTTEVLRPQSSVSAVDIEIASESLGAGEDLTVTVERRGGPTTGTVSVDGDGASFDPASQPVSLTADERTSLQFELDDADDRIPVRAEFTPDDGSESEAAEATLRVPSSAPVPDVDAECAAIDDGNATVEVTVRMSDGSDLPAVSIDPGDVAIDPEQGRSSVTRTVTVPLGTDHLTISIEDSDPVDAAVSVPSTPLSATVRERDDGFVDVTLANDAAVPVDDEVRVAGDPLPATVERPVSLDAGDRLTIAVPAVQTTGEVRIDTATISTTEDVALDRTAFPAAGSPDRGPAARGGSAHDDPSRDRSAAGDSGTGVRTDERSHTADTPDATTTPSRESSPPDAGRNPSAPSTDQAPRNDPADAAGSGRSSPSAGATDRPGAAGSDPASSVADRSGADAADRSPPDAADRSATDAADRSATDAADSSPCDRSRPEPTSEPGAGGSSASRDSIDLSRSLASETVHEGYAIEETLTVENRSSAPQSVTIESGNERAPVEIQSGATATASRYHAGWDVESIEVPSVVARTDGDETAVPSVSIPVEDAPVVVRPALTPRSTSTDVRLTVRNNLETPCSVQEIGSKGFSGSVGFDGFEVAAGDEGSRETTYEGTPTERPALTFVRLDQRRRPLQTLAAVHDAATPSVSVTVASVDVLDDRDTNVVLDVRNEGGSTLDVRLEATGDAPDEYLYSAGEIEGLEPGAVDSHRVECTVEDDLIELPIEISTTPADGGEPQSTTVVASGNRTADADAWRVETEDDAEAVSTLSTPLSISTAD